DRTAVILDIFAQNARTQEGRAQVELALLRYRLPRLRGRGKAFSQQAGGIGTRGPGETQLEVDRRRLLRRITKLESELRDLSKTRRTQRKARVRSGIPTVSIVGYTNAGKSTLLNRLTDAGVLVEDRLFATLDPRTRRLELPGGEAVLVNDTVGFVRKLPHQLVESFQSTLEVVKESDLLVHVVDSAAPDPGEQIDAVRTVLAEIGADRVPELLAFNKADIAPEAKRLVDRHPGSVMLSATPAEGVGRRPRGRARRPVGGNALRPTVGCRGRRPRRVGHRSGVSDIDRFSGSQGGGRRLAPSSLRGRRSDHGAGGVCRHQGVRG